MLVFQLPEVWSSTLGSLVLSLNPRCLVPPKGHGERVSTLAFMRAAASVARVT